MVFAYTVIRFVLKSAKFGICNVVGLNGFKYALGLLDVYISASTNVPFRPKMMQMPNLHKLRRNGLQCTVIHFVRVSAEFGTCTVVSVNGTLAEAQLCTFTLECMHFIFNKCSI